VTVGSAIVLIVPSSNPVKDRTADVRHTAIVDRRGVAVRQGLRFLRAELPRILAAPPDVLSHRMVRIIEGLAEDWRRLDQRIVHLSDEITVVARQDAGCGRLVSVPGIGPIISSAMVAAIGNGDGFSKGRDFAARLGLVPKQFSTGDRTILGKISKRGNRYLRVLFVQAAWVVRCGCGQLASLRWLDPNTEATPKAASHASVSKAGKPVSLYELKRGLWPFRVYDTNRVAGVDYSISDNDRHDGALHKRKSPVPRGNGPSQPLTQSINLHAGFAKPSNLYDGTWA
jgi:hypothetical protein